MFLFLSIKLTMDISYLKPNQLKFAIRSQSNFELPMFDLSQYTNPNDNSHLLSLRHEDSSQDVLMADRTLDFVNKNDLVPEVDYDTYLKDNLEDTSDTTLLNSTIGSHDIIITSTQNSLHYPTMQQSPYNSLRIDFAGKYLQADNMVYNDSNLLQEASQPPQPDIYMSTPLIFSKTEQQNHFKRKLDSKDDSSCKKQKINNYSSFISSEGPEIICMESEPEFSPQISLQSQLKCQPSFPFYTPNDITQMIESSFDPIFHSEE